MKTICFVVATKDRPDDLHRMLESLALQTHLPDLVIVVDSSAVGVSHVIGEFAERLRVQYLYREPPSAAAQRNAGISAVPPGVELIGFLDDDATLEPDALEKMLTFWNKAPQDLGGAAFNMMNHPACGMSWLKQSRLVKALGVYSGEPGRVTLSGWHTMIGCASTDSMVDWLPSGAVLWRSEILRSHRFDPFFTGYGYLEDLDLSFTVRQEWRLAVVALAYYSHYPSPVRHVSPYRFGQVEVRNRLYFVKKHRLSYSKCWLGLTLHNGLTICKAITHLDHGLALRALGNWAGFATELRSIAV